MSDTNERDEIDAEKPVYYAHPVWFYNTDAERADVNEITRQLGLVLNPNQPEHDAAYNERKRRTGQGMDYFFEEVLPSCRACVFRADDDGKISSGVALEIAWFEERGLPVYEIIDGALIPMKLDPTRVLTRDETRARCKTTEERLVDARVANGEYDVLEQEPTNG